MIWDSQPWKSELRQLARDVSAIAQEREHTNESAFRLERAVMFGFFIVRRLHEAHKVTDRTMDAGVRFMRYVPRGAPPDLLNWHRIDEHYDLQGDQRQQLPLKTFCNQAIHSFVFVPSELEGVEREGVFLSSDWERKRSLLYVALKEIRRVFLAVVEDVVQRAVYSRREDDPSEFVITVE